MFNAGLATFTGGAPFGIIDKPQIAGHEHMVKAGYKPAETPRENRQRLPFVAHRRL